MTSGIDARHVAVPALAVSGAASAYALDSLARNGWSTTVAAARHSPVRASLPAALVGAALAGALAWKLGEDGGRVDGGGVLRNIGAGAAAGLGLGLVGFALAPNRGGVKLDLVHELITMGAAVAVPLGAVTGFGALRDSRPD